jgi:hypothetical protein
MRTTRYFRALVALSITALVAVGTVGTAHAVEAQPPPVPSGIAGQLLSDFGAALQQPDVVSVNAILVNAASSGVGNTPAAYLGLDPSLIDLGSAAATAQNVQQKLVAGLTVIAENGVPTDQPSLLFFNPVIFTPQFRSASTDVLPVYSSADFLQYLEGQLANHMSSLGDASTALGTALSASPFTTVVTLVALVAGIGVLICAVTVCTPFEAALAAYIATVMIAGFTVVGEDYNVLVGKCSTTSSNPTLSGSQVYYSGNAACGGGNWIWMRVFIQLYVGGAKDHKTATWYSGIELSCNGCNTKFVDDAPNHSEFACWQASTLLYGTDQNGSNVSYLPVESAMTCF